MSSNFSKKQSLETLQSIMKDQGVVGNPECIIGDKKFIVIPMKNRKAIDLMAQIAMLTAVPVLAGVQEGEEVELGQIAFTLAQNLLDTEVIDLIEVLLEDVRLGNVDVKVDFDESFKDVGELLTVIGKVLEVNYSCLFTGNAGLSGLMSMMGQVGATGRATTEE